AALWAFAAGLLITIGPTASQVGLVSIIMLLVLAHEPLPPGQALVAAGAVLLGGLLEVLVVAIPWPRRAKGGRTVIGSPHAAAAPLPPNPSLSAALHHALRVAVAVAVADTLARGLRMPHGYWIPMTVAIVLKPAVGATITRSLSRLLGTLTGLVLGTLLLETAFGPIAAHVVLFGVFVFLMLAFGPGNYALLVVAVSAIVVVMFSLLGTPPAATMHDRAIATVIGGALALLASLAWPARRGRGTAPAAPGESRHEDAAAQAPPRS
ncbi:MAG: FUSC family protein, partial [Thermomicrobiales bacterium]|nr:FUSC family protein [Thermomicrobiales bacterium]